MGGHGKVGGFCVGFQDLQGIGFGQIMQREVIPFLHCHPSPGQHQRVGTRSLQECDTRWGRVEVRSQIPLVLASSGPVSGSVFVQP